MPHVSVMDFQLVGRFNMDKTELSINKCDTPTHSLCSLCSAMMQCGFIACSMSASDYRLIDCSLFNMSSSDPYIAQACKHSVKLRCKPIFPTKRSAPQYSVKFWTVPVIDAAIPELVSLVLVGENPVFKGTVGVEAHFLRLCFPLLCKLRLPLWPCARTCCLD